MQFVYTGFVTFYNNIYVYLYNFLQFLFCSSSQFDSENKFLTQSSMCQTTFFAVHSVLSILISFLEIRLKLKEVDKLIKEFIQIRIHRWIHSFIHSFIKFFKYYIFLRCFTNQIHTLFDKNYVRQMWRILYLKVWRFRKLCPRNKSNDKNKFSDKVFDYIIKQ